MSGDITPYTDLITSEHADKPKFTAMVAAFVQAFADALETKDTSFSGQKISAQQLSTTVIHLADTDNNLLTPEEITHIDGIYRTDWQGRQLLYDTPRTNYLPYSDFTTANASQWRINHPGNVVAAFSQPGPDGALNAVQLTGLTPNYDGIFQGISTPYPFTGFLTEQFWIKGNGTFHLDFNVFPYGDGQVAVGSSLRTATSQWQPMSNWLQQSGATYTQFRCLVYPGDTATELTIAKGMVVEGKYTVPQSMGVQIDTNGSPLTVTDYTAKSGVEYALDPPLVIGDLVDWDGAYTHEEPVGTLVSLSNAFDLDKAVGAQLDKIGDCVGISRYLDVALSNVYFSLDTAGLGLDEGTWRRPYDPSTGLTILPDDTYRTLLRAKVAANQWDGSLESALAIWDLVFSTQNYGLVIQDYGDMSILFGFLTPKGLDAVTKGLITNGKLNLKPEGVRIRDYVTPSVSSTPFFGLDAETNEVSGLDVGAWATTL